MLLAAHTHPSLQEIPHLHIKIPFQMQRGSRVLAHVFFAGCKPPCVSSCTMCLVMLQESETVYFEESLKTAQEAVAEALGQFNGLLDSLDEAERGKLQRSMGMKMEQLKVSLEFILSPGQAG